MYICFEELGKHLPKRESGTHSPIPRHKPATNRIGMYTELQRQ